MILVVACGIGVCTGAGVVLFNDVIHGIRHLVWQVSSLESRDRDTCWVWTACIDTLIGSDSMHIHCTSCNL